MVFKIVFKVLEQGAVLPYSYQYELSAWIYKMIAQNDSQLATFLHDKGYAKGFKNFKLFTFSNLYLPRFEPNPGGLKVCSSTIELTLSFLVDNVAESIITSLFKHQKLTLGNTHTQVPLQVDWVRAQPFSIANETLFRTTSPLVISDFKVQDNGRTQSQYLHPNDESYQALFFKNLLNKYGSAVQHQIIPPMPDQDYTTALKVISNKVRSKLVTIKANTSAETRVKGYMFDFVLTAPKELIRVGYLAGFGSNSSLGFGATRIVK